MKYLDEYRDPARAQQLACEPCARGDETLHQLGEDGELVRSRGAQIVAIGIAPGGTIEDHQVSALRALLGTRYESLETELARRAPAELTDVAAAVCNAPSDSCQIALRARTSARRVTGVRIPKWAAMA